MRNYVIINGVNSLTIQGLAISSLPPITKPQMRTLREEIDGRNGDIITELGYGAYDKQITIGLFGTFNVDDVIKFFNQSGTITFSNEDDKVYTFSALEQVDFEKLLKFKTATITFHCQPFKYPLNNTPITLTSGNNTINNQGNIYSKPIITLSGSGTISILLNSVQIFSIDMTDITTITIDSEHMEAYDPNSGTLLNRHITGDYSTFEVPIGSNTLTLSGTITAATITNLTRWL